MWVRELQRIRFNDEKRLLVNCARLKTRANTIYFISFNSEVYLVQFARDNCAKWKKLFWNGWIDSRNPTRLDSSFRPFWVIAHRHNSSNGGARKIDFNRTKGKLTCFFLIFFCFDLRDSWCWCAAATASAGSSRWCFQEHLFSIWEIDIDDISPPEKILHWKCSNLISIRSDRIEWKQRWKRMKQMKLFIYWPRGYASSFYII